MTRSPAPEPAHVQPAGVQVGERDAVAGVCEGGGEQQPDGPRPQEQDVRGVREPAGLDPVEDAGEGLGEGGDLEGEGVRTHVGAAPDEPLRNQDGLGERAVEVLEVGAEVLAPRPARTADAAGGGVDHHQAVALADTLDADANGLRRARHLVAERTRNAKHAGVSAGEEDLEVGAAGGGGADAQENLAWPRDRDRLLAQLEALGAEEVGDGACPRGRRSHGRSGPRRILSASRRRASRTAAAVSLNGSRWVTSGVGSSRPEARSANASCCSASPPE